MNNLLVSIIIPVHNAEPYLSRLLSAIDSQTYKNVETIFIENGSVDNSTQILLDWGKNKNNFTLKHSEKVGLSIARNIGCEIAKGDYIFFADADDSFHERTIELLVKELEENSADMAQVGWTRFEKVLPSVPADDYITTSMSTAETFRSLINREKISYFAWGKLYKKYIFEDIRFPEDHLFEDLAVMPFVIEKCSKVTYIDAPLYYYYINFNGICGKLSKNLLSDNLNYLEQLREYACKKYPQLSEEMNAEYIRCSFTIFVGSDYEEVNNKSLSNLKNFSDKYKNNAYLSKRIKQILPFLLVAPYPTKKLVRLISKIK